MGELGRSSTPRGRVPWSTLWEEMYLPMVYFAQRRLGSPSEAEDAVLEAFRRCIEFEPRIVKSPFTPQAWLFGVLKKVTAEALRSRKRAATPLEPEVLESLAGSSEQEEPTPNPEGGVLEALGRLEATSRDIALLKVFAGLGIGEIAEILGVAPSKVSLLWHRTARLLSDYLATSVDASRPTPQRHGRARAPQQRAEAPLASR